ncbi:hypothetical protein EIN_033520 [Entamoeba invadens IP1]|uniref:Uncharacterized protein n=1 Tax=Entamoeba invadens IP1 TaxID=370355 RepID=A0A0A1U466_ENTIV|nr:hypothetical protein EIN_033520 [Entamoeba invadens IP1]ELP86481.1 hypothetical protein EIN_033520 [Entamoeba invadens IP1]|eukprot:XP_004185827.1 hypothetical protein EIN_033520 [Entamoeba invadens IP1]
MEKKVYSCKAFSEMYNNLYVEVKKKKKTETLMLDMVKNATGIKGMKEDQFLEDVKQNQAKYFDPLLKAIESNVTKCCSLALEMLTMFFETDTFSSQWFCRVMKCLNKMETNDELCTKIVIMLSLVFSTPKLVFLFQGDALIDVYCFLFGLVESEKGKYYDNFCEWTFNIFLVLNNNKEQKETSFLEDQVCVLFKEFCCIIKTGRSVVLKTTKTLVSVQMISSILRKNPILFEKPKFLEAVSSDCYQMCFWLLDNAIYNTGVFELVQLVVTKYSYANNFVRLFTKLLGLVTKEKAKEVQFTSIQRISEYFDKTIERGNWKEVVVPSQEFCNFCLEMYARFGSDNIEIPFVTFNVSLDLGKVMASPDGCICCVMTKVLMNVASFLLADKERLTKKEENYTILFGAIQQQMIYFVNTKTPLVLLEEYLKFILNTIGVVLPLQLYEYADVLLSELVKATKTVPLPQNVNGLLGEKEMAFLKCVTDIFTNFGDIFTQDEFHTVLQMIATVKSLSIYSPLIKENKTTSVIFNFAFENSPTWPDETFVHYVETLCVICGTVMKEYRSDTFKIERYYFEELYRIVFSQTKRFVLIKDIVRPIFIKCVEHNEECINSFFFNQSNEVIEKKKLDPFLPIFLELFFDVSFVVFNDKTKSKLGLLDILVTHVDTVVTKSDLNRFFELVKTCATKDVTSQAFTLVKELCKADLLREMDKAHLVSLFSVVRTYVEQNVELNIALSSIELQWNLLEGVHQMPETVITKQEKEDVMYLLFDQMLEEIEDERYDIWFSAAQTLLRAINDQGVFFSDEGWEKLINGIFYSAFQKLKVIVFPKVLNMTDIPRKEDIEKTEIFGRVTTEIRRWNDSVTADLSCVMRSLKVMFKKFKDEDTKKQVYRCILGFTEFAFFRPTIAGIEIGMKYVFKLAPILFDESLFITVDNALVQDTLDEIEMINKFVLFNNGVFTGTSVLYLNLLLDFFVIGNGEVKKRIVSMVCKFFTVFPGDFYVSERGGTLVQEKVLSLFEVILKDKNFNDIQTDVKKSIEFAFDSITGVETVNLQAKKSKWWGVNVLLPLLKVFGLDDEVRERIVKGVDVVIDLFNDEFKVNESVKNVNESYSVESFKKMLTTLLEFLKMSEKIGPNEVKVVECISITQLERMQHDTLILSDAVVFGETEKVFKEIETHNFVALDTDDLRELVEVYGNSLEFKEYGRNVSKGSYQCLVENTLTMKDVERVKVIKNKVRERVDALVQAYNEESTNCRIAEVLFVIESVIERFIASGDKSMMRWSYIKLVDLVPSPNQPIRAAVQKALSKIGEQIFVD